MSQRDAHEETIRRTAERLYQVPFGATGQEWRAQAETILRDAFPGPAVVVHAPQFLRAIRELRSVLKIVAVYLTRPDPPVGLLREKVTGALAGSARFEERRED
jgi:hypothetical protein